MVGIETIICSMPALAPAEKDQRRGPPQRPQQPHKSQGANSRGLAGCRVFSSGNHRITARSAQRRVSGRRSSITEASATLPASGQVRSSHKPSSYSPHKHKFKKKPPFGALLARVLKTTRHRLDFLKLASRLPISCISRTQNNKRQETKFTSPSYNPLSKLKSEKFLFLVSSPRLPTSPSPIPASDHMSGQLGVVAASCVAIGVAGVRGVRGTAAAAAAAAAASSSSAPGSGGALPISAPCWLFASPSPSVASTASAAALGDPGSDGFEAPTPAASALSSGCSPSAAFSLPCGTFGGQDIGIAGIDDRRFAVGLAASSAASGHVGDGSTEAARALWNG
jgi:hypothetical protein